MHKDKNTNPCSHLNVNSRSSVTFIKIFLVYRQLIYMLVRKSVLVNLLYKINPLR
jgi:hypothetical protein